MIDFYGVSKSYGQISILENVSLSLPAGRCVALLGRNGAGKSTVLSMIAGSLAPDRGEIRVGGSVSWPVGFAGAFHPDLTGAQNARFVARLYGHASPSHSIRVARIARLGAQYYAPFRTYSSGMRARLAFAVSMSIRFDYYLIDEITAVGDASFRKQSTLLLRERLHGAGGIVVSHSLGVLRDLCSAALVADRGKLHAFADLEEGISYYQRLETSIGVVA